MHRRSAPSSRLPACPRARRALNVVARLQLRTRGFTSLFFLATISLVRPAWLGGRQGAGLRAGRPRAQALRSTHPHAAASHGHPLFHHSKEAGPHSSHGHPPDPTPRRPSSSTWTAATPTSSCGWAWRPCTCGRTLGAALPAAAAARGPAPASGPPTSGALPSSSAPLATHPAAASPALPQPPLRALPLQLAMSLLLAEEAFLFSPSSPKTDAVKLHASLQAYAWTEAEARRALPPPWWPLLLRALLQLLPTRS